MQRKEFQAKTKDIGTRLDLIISTYDNNLSRTAVKKAINDGQVEINGEVEYRPNYKVLEGDVITYTVSSKVEIDSIVPEDIHLEIVFEDQDLLVVNKPAGMVVHPATGNWSGTLMNGVVYHYQKMNSVGDSIRSGLIHRLDKETSGLVMIGKTNKGLWHYSRLFAERQIQKTYVLATNRNAESVIGRSITKASYIGRNPQDRKKMAEVDSSRGKYAETIFSYFGNAIDEGFNYSLVKASPKTGRTHQIRVHASSLGIPILGDSVYGKGNPFRRLMLHAWKLSLVLISGQEVTFEANLPRGFIPNDN